MMMANTTSIDAMKELWRSAYAAFPLNTEGGEADALAAGATIPRSLLGGLPLTPVAGDTLTDVGSFPRKLMRQSEAAELLFLRAELDAMEAARNGETCETARPFGFRETLYPVVVEDQVWAVLWSGKYRDRVLSSEALQHAAEQVGLSVPMLTDLLQPVPVWTAADILRHKRMMSALRDAFAGAIGAHVQAHNATRQLLESERIRSLGTLSTGIAHHFNNLLSVILGYSSHLLNREELPASVDEPLRQISDAAQKGRRLTMEILSFAGSKVEEETSCSVHQILESICPLLEAQSGTRVRFVRNLNAAQDRVRSQRSVLHQSLFNMLINELDSMTQSGELLLHTENIQRHTEAGPTEHIRIFVADGSTSGGEGAALPTVQAELVLGLDHAQLPPAAATPPPPRRLAVNQIWVVDDDAIFSEMCERVLSDDGQQVRVIPSGPELQKEWQAAKAKPSLLIIDFSMPDYNGLELCTWLRENGCRAPVILVSGFSHTHPDIHKALKMRKTFFLQKPFPVPELADMVSVALGETLLGNA
jgi:CheY-like chemotaxis protein/signal transduction histidine kinase